MHLKKIISGGQTGADQGGLEAAKNFGLETGGWIPLGFLTENGEEPSLGEKYGLKEIDVGGHRGYIVRTYKNVEDSDATIRIATRWNSPGERCTLNAINRYEKPAADFDASDGCFTDKDVEAIASWLELHGIEVLNVAGNRETFSPGLRKLACEFLTAVFEDLASRYRRNEEDDDGN